MHKSNIYKSLSLIIIILMKVNISYCLSPTSKINPSAHKSKTIERLFIAMCLAGGVPVTCAQCANYENPYPDSRFARLNPSSFDNQIAIQLHPSQASLQGFDNVRVFGNPQTGWFNSALTFINLESFTNGLNALEQSRQFQDVDVVNPEVFNNTHCYHIDALTLIPRLAAAYKLAGNPGQIDSTVQAQLDYLANQSTQKLAQFIREYFFPVYSFWFTDNNLANSTYIDLPEGVDMLIAQDVKNNPTIENVISAIKERVPDNYLLENNNITTGMLLPRLRTDLKQDLESPYNSTYNEAFDAFLAKDYAAAEQGFYENFTDDATFNLGLSRLAITQQRYENGLTNDSIYAAELNNTAQTFGNLDETYDGYSAAVQYLYRIAIMLAELVPDIPITNNTNITNITNITNMTVPSPPNNSSNITNSSNPVIPDNSTNTTIMMNMTNSSNPIDPNNTTNITNVSIPEPPSNTTNNTQPEQPKSKSSQSLLNVQNIAIGGSLIGSLAAVIIACLKCRKKDSNMIIVDNSGEIALPEVHTTGSEITDILRIIQELSEAAQKEGASHELMSQIDGLAQAVGLEVNDASSPQSRLRAIAQHYQEMAIIDESA